MYCNDCNRTHSSVLCDHLSITFSRIRRVAGRSWTNVFIDTCKLQCPLPHQKHCENVYLSGTMNSRKHCRNGAAEGSHSSLHSSSNEVRQRNARDSHIRLYITLG